MIPGLPPTSMGAFGLYIGKVVDVHPEHNSVDVTLMSDQRRLVSVPVVGSANSGNSGVIDLPIPDLTTGRDEDSKWKSQNTDKRDIMAVIGFVESAPVCFGFVYPPLSEMNFKGDIAKERRLFRHASDWYSWIDKDANVQVCHPSGTYLTLAEDHEKLDLSGKDYDKLWGIKKNLKRAVHAFMSFFDSGTKETARAHLKPEGDLYIRLEKRSYICIGADGEEVQVEMKDDGTVSVTCTSDVTVDSGGSVDVTAAESVTVDAGTSVDVTAGSSVTVSAGASVEVTAAASVEVSGATVNVSAASVSVSGAAIDISGAMVNINGIVMINGIIQVGN